MGGCIMKLEKRMPSLSEAIIGFIFVMGVIILGIRFKAGMQTPLILGAMASTLYALYLGNPWSNIEKSIIKGISNAMIANLILILSGILVGVWILGGTVPTLIYYGLEILSPSMFLPITFIICMVTSLATGTSFGTISSVGLALSGISIGLGMPMPMTIGAIVSGAFFGDKMSPISDTTNIAPAMAGGDLFEHVNSMLYTTVPAAVISFILYAILGSKHASSGTDMAVIQEILKTINTTFNISVWTILPPLLLIVLSIKRVPAIATLSIVSVFSLALPMITQGVDFKSVLVASMSGYSSETGLAVVDNILSRGGIIMMTESVVMIIAATAMGGVLEECGILKVIIGSMLKKVKSYKGLVVTTLISSFAVVIATGNMVLGIVLPGRTLKTAYEDMDIHSKVLSRSLEDVGTLTNSIIPWGGACIFIQAIFKTDTSYIPYAFLNYLTPIIALIFALTGFAIWNRDGISVRKINKINIETGVEVN
jgi:NhaC family Na+:H+ antiporter